jgi:predicted NACHT family NTPase
MLASTGNDLTVRLWDVESGEELQRLTGHKDFVQSVAFHPEGTLLASASFDQTVRLWNLGISADEWQAMGESWRDSAEREIAELKEYERQKREERERLDREAQERAEEEARQRQIRRAMAQCEVCGTPLTLWERMRAKTRCKKHKKTSMSAVAGDE